jgi:hypothetical protein
VNFEQCYESRFGSKTVSIESFCILAIPSLLCDCEIWTLKQNVIRRLRRAEIKFIIHMTGYSLIDRRRNEDTIAELSMDSTQK